MKYFILWLMGFIAITVTIYSAHIQDRAVLVIVSVSVNCVWAFFVSVLSDR